jgi:hypothetical protein
MITVVKKYTYLYIILLLTACHSAAVKEPALFEVLDSSKTGI